MQIGIELTSKLVEDLLLELNWAPDRTPLTLLELAEIHEARPLLASAWQAEGAKLSPGLAYELDLYRTRADGHRRLFEELSRAVPGIEAVKGFRIADLYPAGWVRGGKDLDLRARTQDDVWDVARYLTDKGWKRAAAFLQRIGGDDAMVLTLTSASLDPLVMRPEAVEVGCTLFAPGNFFGLSPRLVSQLDRPLDPLVSHLLGILEQRLERKVVVRDLVDAVVLLREMDTSRLEGLWEVVDTLLLWKELGELAFALDELELVPRETLMPERLAARRQQAQKKRVLRAAARALSPTVLARQVVHKTSVTWEGPLAEAVGARLSALVPAARVYRAGLPLIGLPVAPEITREGLVTHTVAGHLVSTCPLGTFLMVYGGSYEPEWMDEIRRAYGLPPTPAQPDAMKRF